jgi:hypothetical protein
VNLLRYDYTRFRLPVYEVRTLVDIRAGNIYERDGGGGEFFSRVKKLLELLIYCSFC